MFSAFLKNRARKAFVDRLRSGNWETVERAIAELPGPLTTAEALAELEPLALGDGASGIAIGGWNRRTERLTVTQEVLTNRHVRSAIAALGRLPSPAASEALCEVLQTMGGYAVEAVAALRSAPHRDVPAGRFGALATTATDFETAEWAVKALRSLGTPEAQDALDAFTRQPARKLPSQVAAALRSTAALGQVPDEDFIAEVRRRKAAGEPFRYGDEAEIAAALRRCFEDPSASARLVDDLALLLTRGCPDAASTRSRFGSQAEAVVSERSRAAWPAKLAVIRAHFATEDSARLETYLLNRFLAGSSHAFELYLQLPNPRPVAELPGLSQSFPTLQDLRDFVTSRPIREALAKIELARSHPDNVDLRLRTLVEVSHVVTPEGREALIDEFAGALLTRPEWAVRRAALNALAQLPHSDAEPFLRAFLASEETDFELRQYAHAALERS